MKQIFKMAALAGTLFLASCFGQHNSAPNKGINLDDTRIFGDKGAEPRQLKNKYPADEVVAQRAEAIRAKLYPKEGVKTDSATVAGVIASMKAAQEAAAKAAAEAAAKEAAAATPNATATPK